MRPVDAVQHKAEIGLGEFLERLVELLAVEIDVVNVGVFGRLRHREHDALVFLRRQLLRGVQIEEADQAQDRQREQAGNRPIVERAVEPAAVPAGHRAEHPVHDPGKASLFGALQEDRAHHRRQRQRDHAGHDHGARQRKGKFAKQRTGQAAEEADRRVNRRKRDRHRDDRTDDLAGALE